MSTETPNLSKTSITGRKFTFTSPFNSMQSPIVTVNDNKNTSTRKFTLTSPIFLDQLHSEIEKVTYVSEIMLGGLKLIYVKINADD